MAKQLVNPIERHAEKAVLAVTGLILLGVVAKFLVMSPNRIELGAESVAPKEIDAKVLAKAEAVRQHIRNQQPKVEPYAPLSEEFVKSMRPLTALGLSNRIAASQPIGPDVPFIDPPQAQGDKARLVEVLPLGKPKFTTGRMLLDGQGAKGSEPAVDWVTVSAVFQRQAQSELQQRSYGMKWSEVYFGPPDVQRRPQRADGSWSDEDWEDIEGFYGSGMLPIPNVPLVHEPKRVTVAKDDAANIEKFQESLVKPLEQLSIIRPLPPVEPAPRTWAFPVLTSKRDVALQDDEYINPNDLPAANPTLLRYPWLDEAGATPTEKPKSPDPQDVDPRKLFENGKKLFEAAKKERSVEGAHSARQMLTEAYNKGTADLQSRADRLLKEVNELIDDLKFSATAAAKPSDEKKPRREPLPAQQIWVHDAVAGSIRNGETYQYRMRPAILNRLLGIPERMENPQDATIALLKGPWSEPSDPVTIEPAVQFFVGRADETKREITVEAFQWFRGVWVDGRRKLKVGDRLDWEERVVAPHPEKPQSDVFRPLVRFGLDARIADVDFDRRTRERKVEKGGVKLLPADRSASVVLVRDTGELHERFENLDRNDPTKAAIKGKLFKEPKRAGSP